MDGVFRVRAEVVGWVDGSFPGWVEVHLEAPDGSVYSLIDKAPVFDSTGNLSPPADLPAAGPPADDPAAALPVDIPAAGPPADFPPTDSSAADSQAAVPPAHLPAAVPPADLPPALLPIRVEIPCDIVGWTSARTATVRLHFGITDEAGRETFEVDESVIVPRPSTAR